MISKHAPKSYRKPSEYSKATVRAMEDSSRHTIKTSVSKSVVFSQPGTSNRWFQLTWTPGHFFMSGDLGELSISHYHAAGKFEDGLHWLANSHIDYLLGKTNTQKEFSRGMTLQNLAEFRKEIENPEDKEATLDLMREIRANELMPDEAARKISDLMDCDYYGSYVWPWHSMYQVAMMRIAASAWIEQIKKEKFDAIKRDPWKMLKFIWKNYFRIKLYSHARIRS